MGFRNGSSEAPDDHETDLPPGGRRVAPGPVSLRRSPRVPSPAAWPAKIRVVLDNARPLAFPRGGRLPLFLWPAMDPGDLEPQEPTPLCANSTAAASACSWSWQSATRTARSAGLALARVQKRLGVPVSVNATALLYGFFDGDPEPPMSTTRDGRFSTIPSVPRVRWGARSPSIRAGGGNPRAGRRLRPRLYKGRLSAALRLGRLGDRRARSNSTGPTKRRGVAEGAGGRIPDIGQFPRLPEGRPRHAERFSSEPCSASPSGSGFPAYGWAITRSIPTTGTATGTIISRSTSTASRIIADRRAKYRLWANDFPATGYTFAMPVVYPWARLFGWYDFAETDYRWFYNMLLEASGAGRSTPPAMPVVAFVHFHPIDPEKFPAPGFRPMSRDAYRELLWHILLRGADTFYLWAGEAEYPLEVRLLHEVWSEAQRYGEFLDGGRPVSFDVPANPAPVVSGLRLGNRILVRRTEFGSSAAPVFLTIGGRRLDVPPAAGRCVVLTLPER